MGTVRTRSVLHGTVLAWCLLLGVVPCLAQLFGPPVPLCTACFDYSPDVVDADGDGDMDVLVEGQLYANDGTGVFAAPLPVPAGLPYDMDNDGLLDFVSDGGWNRNNGAGYDAFEETGAVGIISDLDQDGDLDRIAGQLAPEGWVYALLYMNDGTGHFAVDSVFLTANGSTVLYTPYDWDVDGDLDLIGAEGLNRSLVVSYSVNGVFGSPFVGVSAALTGGWGSMIVDVNADGLDDYNAGPVLFLRSAAGVYQEFDGVSPTPFYSIVNVDCDPELEVISFNPNGTSVLLRITDLTPEGLDFNEALFDPPSAYPGPSRDLNGDGKADVIYLDQALGGIHIRFNVAEPPAVSLDLPEEILTEDTVLTLFGGLPAGGFYTGPGVFDNVFHGSLAGTGPVQIAYHYIDPISTCTNVAYDELQRSAVNGLEETSASGWASFPNPCHDRLLVVAPSTGTAMITVLDAMGRERGTTQRTTLQGSAPVEVLLGDLEDGLFVLLVQTADGDEARLPFLRTR